MAASITARVHELGVQRERERMERVHTVLDCETCDDTGMALECLCGCGHTLAGDLCPMREVECYECGGQWPDGTWKSW